MASAIGTSRKGQEGPTLHRQARCEHEVCLLLILGDVCIGMQAKHLRICRQWQSLDEVQVGGVVAIRWRPIQARGAELVV